MGDGSVLASLAQFLPIAAALLPLSAPLPAWLGIDLAPLVALELVERLPEPCPAGMVQEIVASAFHGSGSVSRFNVSSRPGTSNGL